MMAEGWGRSIAVSLGTGIAACVLLMAGCAPLPADKETKSGPLVYPPPPEEPRFYYERTIYSSADVLPPKDRDLRSVVTGEDSGGKGLSKPYGIAVDNGRVYVSDVGGVHLFDIPGKRYERVGDRAIGGDEGTAALMPLGLDTDALGNLYVVDGQSEAKAVLVYDRKGKFLRKFGGPKMLQRPVGIAVEKHSSRVFVVDGGGIDSNLHRISVFDGHTGNHLFDIGKRGKGPGDFNLPRDAAFGKDGLLYVVDGGNFRVQVFTPDGKYVRAFGGVGRRGGQFARPKEIASDTEGNMYIIDSAFANFQIFDPNDKLLLFIGDRGGADAPGHFMLPSGIAVDTDGRIYVVDQFYRKIDVFRPASAKVAQAEEKGK